jgi:hypothetical protein
MKPMSRAPNNGVIANHAGMMVFSTYICVAGYKDRPFDVDSRRAFDILLSYHLGSAAFPRTRRMIAWPSGLHFHKISVG